VAPSSLRYERPGRLDEAIELLTQCPDEAMVLAGGQSLLPLLKLRFIRPSCLVDLGGLDELNGWRTTADGASPGGLVLGAMSRHAEVTSMPEVTATCPLLAAAAASIGDPHVRNRGTLGGGLCHADPSGALPAAAMAADCVLGLVGPDGDRRVPASQFYIDYLTADLLPGEVLTEVTVPAPPEAQGWGFLELRQRRMELATLVVAVQLHGSPGEIRRARVVVGGAGPVPIHLPAAEEALQGQRPTADLARAVEPLIPEGLGAHESDLASADYKWEMAGVLGRRAILQAMARLDGGER
jgi:aerobic carbon-monoxide dehydrogenase medium subunit